MSAGENRVLLALILGGALLSGAEAAPPPLAVAEAQRQTLPREQILDGVVEAVHQSTVSAQTAGRVDEIMVDVNDFVKVGAPIIRLRNTEQRAGLGQAEAALSEAQARYREAQAEYNRIKEVYDKKLISKAQMDAATAALEAAKARLDAAQAQVTQAKEQLGYTTIIAPYSGIVLERHVELGESVQPGKPLMTGFSLEELRVVANVPQRLIVPVRQYRKARVMLPNGQGSVPAAELTFFPYADPQSNVFKVRVYLPKGAEGLYPGMYVKTVFDVGEASRLVIPRQAVVSRSEVTGVYVVKDDRVSLRQVRLGRATADGMIEVLAGLEAGEQVALDPVAAGIYLKEPPAGTQP